MVGLLTMAVDVFFGSTTVGWYYLQHHKYWLNFSLFKNINVPFRKLQMPLKYYIHSLTAVTGNLSMFPK